MQGYERSVSLVVKRYGGGAQEVLDARRGRTEYDRWAGAGAVALENGE